MSADELVVAKCHICGVFLNVDFAKRAKLIAQPNELFGQLEKMMTQIKEPDETMRRIYQQVQPTGSPGNEQLLGIYLCETCEKELRESREGCSPPFATYPDTTVPDVLGEDQQQPQ